MQHKTICFFNSAKVWGGGEKWHYEMAKRMAQKGYRVIAFVDKRSAWKYKFDSTTVKYYEITIDNLSFLNYFKLLYIANTLKNENVSHIVMNLPADVKIAGRAAKHAGVEHIIYRRGSAVAIKNSWLNRYLFGNVITRILANSQKTVDTILENNPNLFDRDKIKVIYNGIDIDEYDRQPIENPKRNENKITIGNVGRMVPQKGHKYLIDIAEKLMENRSDFDVRIGGSGVLEKEIKQYTKQKNVANVVRFDGFVENVPNFMHGIDVFALTSLWEGFGYVIVEAMLAGKPVVAFDISSNPEIIDDDKTGFLVPFNDMDKFIQRIELLMNDKELRKKMGEEARRQAVVRFSIQRTVDEFEKYITQK